MKKIIIKLLAFFSRLIIKKYQPKIVGITGSVGKTSTKEYIYHVLSSKFRVRASIKNYNNEFGLPLTIIGVESPGKNIFGWIKVFFLAKKLLIFRDKNFPEILVLEMGIDRPNDMDYLLSIVRPDVGVLTNISHSHIEYFGSVDKIKKEKSKLVKNIKKDGLAVLNADNKYLTDLPNEIKNRVVFYGVNNQADVLAKDINFILPNNLLQSNFYGVHFKLEYQGSVIPVVLNEVISYPSIYSSLASIAVANFFGLSLMEIINNLTQIPKLPGRMSVLAGIKNSIIIDDTYNSSPESSLSALEAVKKIKLNNGRKIAIFGDMLELGNYSEEGHQIVGRKLAEINIDILFLIGERARDIGRGAIGSNFKEENIFSFARKEEAINFIKDKINEGDLILVKGSQGAYMEKIVKEIMNEPERAKELLVRQDDIWLK